MPDPVPVAEPKTRRPYTRRIKHTFDEKKVQALALQGMNSADIGKVVGKDQSTIWRYLDAFTPKNQALTRFKTHRADVLATLQAHSLQVQAKIVETLDDGVIATLKPGEKTGLLMALNAQHGTLFDKERLERGQSTQNQSIVTTLLNRTIKELYAPATPQVSRSTKRSRKQAAEPQ